MISLVAATSRAEMRAAAFCSVQRFEVVAHECLSNWRLIRACRNHGQKRDECS